MDNLSIIRRNITIIALNILIEDYSIALEDKELTTEERNFLITCIHESEIYLNELISDLEETHNIKRPIWKH